MKIRWKIIILFTLGAIVPLLLSHFFATRMVSQSIRESIAENLTLSATQTAGRIDDYLERSIKELIRATEAVPFADFPPEQLRGALEIPYRQIDGATTIAILDENGSALTAPFTKSDEEALALQREPVARGDLSSFEKNVPFKLALTAEVAIGPVYLSSINTPRLVMASPYERQEGLKPWVVASEISLVPICTIVEINDRIESQKASLVDALGRDVCGGKGSSSGELKTYGGFERIKSAAGPGVKPYVNDEGETILEVVDEVSVTGWRLVLDQPEKTAMKPVARSLYWTVFWIFISLTIALCGGVLLAREITRPISTLEKAAVRIAGGDYEKKIDFQSRDELGALAEAFNRMTLEIKTWNRELNNRVEEQTRALREAEDQILRTQKLAAIGELGSGVAHEINNPLTGVIGVAQLLKSVSDPKSEQHDGLSDIIENARKVADIVEALLKLSQERVPSKMHPVDTSKVMSEVLDMFESRFEQKKITTSIELENECFVFAQENDLRLAFNHVVDNALRAAPQSGQVEINIHHVEGMAVLVTVADNGPGMPEEIKARAFDPFYTTANPGSSARGLGLPLVNNIVEEHDGRIVIDSKEAEGTRVNIYFPGATRLSRD